MRALRTILLVAAATMLVAGSAPGSGGARKPTAIAVSAVDFQFRLSADVARAGIVRFTVVNRGSAQHDFEIAHRKTGLLSHGQRAVLTVKLSKPGRYSFLCTVPGHAKLGMKGTFVVGPRKGPLPKPSPPTQPPPPTTPPAGTKVALTEIGTFERPDYVTAPPGDSHRVFVVEQRGVIQLLVDGVVQPEPFLDIQERVSHVVERGLLGMAFAPDYETSGLFYLDFTDRAGNGNVNVMEFRRNATNPNVADPDSGRQVLYIVKPWENHNAGMLQFGPDGYLYVAVGDGDSGVINPPGRFAQTLDDLLGNVLRIDPRQAGSDPYSVPASNPLVGVAGARPEIWAYGLRNPWRFWVDPKTADLFIGDVGLGTAEEIDYEPGGKGGFNFGWPCFEGVHPFDPTAVCPNAVPPLFDYLHADDACSVIGGLVLHDPRLPSLDGRYLYTDLCGGKIESLLVSGGAIVEKGDLGVGVEQPTSFGEDALGRAYVTTLGGQVYRLDPAGG